jgi:hypothetical protein
MKTRYFLLAFAALVLMSGMVAAQYDGAVSLANLSVSPNPIVAGGNATIRFQLYNAYESWFYGATIQPSGSYPLFNVSPLSSNIIGLLDSGLNSRDYNYTIRIPNTTPSGVYTVTFTTEYFVYAATGTETASSAMPINFYVNNRPAIKVVVSSLQPAALYSGHNQTVDLQVENTGYGTARNVSVVVSSGDGINILSSVSRFFISNLTQGSSVTEPLLVSAQSTRPTHIPAAAVQQYPEYHPLRSTCCTVQYRIGRSSCKCWGHRCACTVKSHKQRNLCCGPAAAEPTDHIPVNSHREHGLRKRSATRLLHERDIPYQC